MGFFEPYKNFSNSFKVNPLTLYFLLFTFTLHPFFANSQVTAPVQASITLSKPYSLRLSDYVQAGTSHISANLTLLNNTSDPTVDRVQVKLRLIIENNTIRISTPETYQSPNSITLTEGVPELLDASDLAEYFDPKNLDFVGLDKAQYLQTGRLPEGFYTFRLEVYEYFRGTRLTNQSPSALAWLILNDPPRWVIPSSNQKLTATNPQNLLFQWLPMHTGSPNAVSGVQYDLTMVELWPNTTQNPNDALNTLSPFYTVNDIETNSLLIGPDAPQLIPGRTYALRLRARDFSGFDLFKNNGYSEVVAFTFGDACLAAESPSAKARNSKEADVNWLSKSNHSAYQVKYREAGQTVWYTDNASINDWTIRNLNPSKTYEYTIAAQCQTLLSNETEVATFVTPAATKADGNCDSPSPTTNAVNKSARKVLFPGESYTSARTGKVMLTMDNIIKQPNGKFGGVGSSNFGWMPVPFAVEVTDLEVDLDGVLLDGKFKTITYGVYVIDARTYAQAEGTLNYAATLLSGNPPSDANLTKLQDTLKSIRNLPPAAAALIQQGIAEIRAGKTDSGTATVQQGLAQAKTELGRAANIGGNVIGGGNANGKDLKPITGLNITFSNAPESKYGFDVKTDDLLSSTYEQENGTYIPWKAIESGKTDPLLVTVSITGNKIKRDSIRYATHSGAKLALASNRISPVGGSDGIKTELYALYPTTGSGTQNVAQVNVVGYTKEMNTVVIIPLGAALPMTEQVLMDSLNLIFGQAVAGFSVEVKPVFKSGWTGTISIGGTGMLAAYTQSQRDIINEYKNANKDLSSSKYYVFVGGTPSDRSILGYMPRARKYGFIFDRTTTAKTLAHELGHGVFQLQHAFDEKNLPRTGNNLMSYGSGTKLHKYQWDKVHNPEFVLGLLEEDENAMSTNSDCENIYKLTANSDFIKETGFSVSFSNISQLLDAEKTNLNNLPTTQVIKTLANKIGHEICMITYKKTGNKTYENTIDKSLTALKCIFNSNTIFVIADQGKVELPISVLPVTIATTSDIEILPIIKKAVVSNPNKQFGACTNDACLKNIFNNILKSIEVAFDESIKNAIINYGEPLVQNPCYIRGHINRNWYMPDYTYDIVATDNSLSKATTTYIANDNLTDRNFEALHLVVRKIYANKYHHPTTTVSEWQWVPSDNTCERKVCYKNGKISDVSLQLKYTQATEDGFVKRDTTHRLEIKKIDAQHGDPLGVVGYLAKHGWNATYCNFFVFDLHMKIFGKPLFNRRGGCGDMFANLFNDSDFKENWMEFKPSEHPGKTIFDYSNKGYLVHVWSENHITTPHPNATSDNMYFIQAGASVGHNLTLNQVFRNATTLINNERRAYIYIGNIINGQQNDITNHELQYE